MQNNHITLIFEEVQQIQQNKAMIENDGFFPTQIAQKGAEDPEQIEQSPNAKQKQTQAQNHKSLKSLLIAFNSYDKQQKGLISLQQGKKILQQRGIPIDKFDVHYKISMPIQNGSIAFDEFLFVLGLCQDTSLDVNHKYQICKKVDKRLVEFLKLLNNYRKKSQLNGNYNEAKKSKSKIEQIRQRQLERRKKYLSILHQHEISQLEQKQKLHFEQFCNTWDQFMMDYQKTAGDLIQRLQQKHQTELKQFQDKTREELGSKIKFSKQIIELEAKQKSLVRLQQYEKASIVQRQVEDLKIEFLQRKKRVDEETIEIRCQTLKRQQLAAVSTLLQNIQKDRNDQLKQRKQDSEKLIIRNKSLLNELNHKHGQAVRKIYEALHNISIQNEKTKGKEQKKFGTTN